MIKTKTTILYFIIFFYIGCSKDSELRTLTGTFSYDTSITSIIGQTKTYSIKQNTLSDSSLVFSITSKTGSEDLGDVMINSSTGEISVTAQNSGIGIYIVKAVSTEISGEVSEDVTITVELIALSGTFSYNIGSTSSVGIKNTYSINDNTLNDDNPTYSIILKNGSADIDGVTIDSNNGDILVTAQKSGTGFYEVTAQGSGDHTGDIIVVVEITAEFTDTDNDGITDDLDIDDNNNNYIDIYTIDDLNNMRNNLAASSVGLLGLPGNIALGYEIMNDLDFNNDADYENLSLKTDFTTGTGWIPIGDASNPFKADFNGNNFVVKNLFINGSGIDNIDRYGLFGYIQSNNILNLGVEAISITSSDSNHSGVISASMNNVIITNCHVIVDTISGNHVGGLAAEMSAVTVTNCYVIANNISATSSGGGLAGSTIINSTIKNSYAIINGTIGNNNINGDVGGFIGFVSDGTISNCFVKTKSISTGGGNIGGFVGLSDKISVSNSYAITESFSVSGGAIAQGFIGGLFLEGTVSSCFWDITTSGVTNSLEAQGKTTAELQTPTSQTGIYKEWMDWDFGTNSDYPGLIIDGVIHRP